MVGGDGNVEEDEMRNGYPIRVSGESFPKHGVIRIDLIDFSKGESLLFGKMLSFSCDYLVARTLHVFFPIIENV